MLENERHEFIRYVANKLIDCPVHTPPDQAYNIIQVVLYALDEHLQRDGFKHVDRILASHMRKVFKDQTPTVEYWSHPLKFPRYLDTEESDKQQEPPY